MAMPESKNVHLVVKADAGAALARYAKAWERTKVAQFSVMVAAAEECLLKRLTKSERAAYFAGELRMVDTEIIKRRAARRDDGDPPEPTPTLAPSPAREMENA